MIFHIVKRGDWQQALDRRRYEPPSLAAEGFIHCSTLTQTLDTANRLFRGQTDLLLLYIDPEAVAGPLEWEPPADPGDERQAEIFPHLYGALNLDAVVQAVPFPCDPDGSFRWPQTVLT
ncbi:MAG: DUF952 domain-containing protein [Terriglobia bacterium]|nr:MAG: DUF952 domain-containing protein [Terriglobia bacterium]